MEAIKDTVKNVIRALEAQKRGPSRDNPERLLKKVLSKKDLRHVRFNYFRKGILSIKVDSSVWLYHLSLQKETLLTKLSKKSQAIKDLHFCIGEIR